MGKVSEWVLRMEQLMKSFDARRHWIEHGCIYGVNNFCNGRANNSGGGKTKNEDRETCKYFVNGECAKRKEDIYETNC